MFSIITKQNELKQAQDNLRKILMTGLNYKVRNSIGGQEKDEGKNIHYSDKYGIWYLYGGVLKNWRKTKYSRYSNIFGLGNPNSKSNLQPVLNINIPIKGKDTLISGVFAIGKDQKIYLMHRGNFGSSKTGIDYDYIHKTYNGRKINLEEYKDKKIRDILYIGSISDPIFLNCLSRFIKDVYSLKCEVKKM